MPPSGENHENGRSLQSYSRVRVSRYEHGDEEEEGDQQQNHPGQEIRSIDEWRTEGSGEAEGGGRQQNRFGEEFRPIDEWRTGGLYNAQYQQQQQQDQLTYESCRRRGDVPAYTSYTNWKSHENARGASASGTYSLGDRGNENDTQQQYHHSYYGGEGDTQQEPSQQPQEHYDYGESAEADYYGSEQGQQEATAETEPAEPRRSRKDEKRSKRSKHKKGY